MLSTSFSKSNQILASICGFLLIVLAVLPAADIVSREFFYPIHFVPELSVFLLITITYLGLAPCETKDKHVKLDLLSRRISKGLHHWHARSVSIISAFAALILTLALIKSGISSFITGEGTEGMITLQLWPVKLIMSLGAILYFLEIVRKGICLNSHSLQKSN